jgi:rhamnose transport system permease protein
MIATAPGRWRHLAKVFFGAREVSILIVVLAVFGLTTAYNTSFADLLSVQQLLVGASVMMILAVGETMVIITRNVDLSIGSVLGISAYAVGDIFLHNPHFPVILGFVAGAGVGALCGVVNGAIVVVARVPSLVVTLGTLYAIRGLDAIFVNGIQINPSSIPNSFLAVGYETILGVPWIFVIAAILVLLVGYVMRAFRPARDLYAIGSDPDAAVLAGVPARRRVFFTFVLSGTIAGFAGGLWLSEFATVSSVAGLGYELLVIAGVVVGGVAIFGGSGTVLGAALGVILLNTINQALVALRISSFWDEALAGALLITAIAFDRYVFLRRERANRARIAAHATA